MDSNCGTFQRTVVREMCNRLMPAIRIDPIGAPTTLTRTAARRPAANWQNHNFLPCSGTVRVVRRGASGMLGTILQQLSRPNVSRSPSLHSIREAFAYYQWFIGHLEPITKWHLLVFISLAAKGNFQALSDELCSTETRAATSADQSDASLA